MSQTNPPAAPYHAGTPSQSQAQTRLHTKIRNLQHQMDNFTWRCSEIRLSTQDRFQGIIFLTQCHANQQFLLEEVRGIKAMLIDQGFTGL